MNIQNMDTAVVWSILSQTQDLINSGQEETCMELKTYSLMNETAVFTTNDPCSLEEFHEH